ncbi:uncharacterized protein LOC120191445 [Hibiscus syriacus]|uniref:uncharacterized protein LOC120191445 n=1 Tax=Hibiscus syriacus TaxID=106335 RepID=UPI001920ADB3|nr:uncharacterized protein LOC120191445 [Hibiscus syriacus]
MSWLPRSLANSLTLDDDDESAASRVGKNYDVIRVSQSPAPPNEETKAKEEQQSLSPQQVDELHGIKEDLTQLKDSLTRQLFGVASFLAPLPPLPPSSTKLNGQSNDRPFSTLNHSDLSDRSISRDEDDPSDSAAVVGIGEDFAEIGGTLSKMASDYFPFGREENQEQYEMENESEEEEDQEFDVVGITDEVLTFARNIAHHPETWLDFSLDPDEDLDDFDMSDAQLDHVMAIEYLAPRLAALRIELCPCHMSDGYFWKVYFVLLHSRLNKVDAEVLSTPQVMEARSLWMKELQKQTMPGTDWYGGSTSREDSHSRVHNDLIPSSNYFAFETISPRTYASEAASSFPTDYETKKHPVESVEMPIVDKSVVEEKQVSNAEDKGTPVGPPSKIWIPDFDDEEIDWPEDEGPELGSHNGAALCPEDVENISFSDLEDSDEDSTRAKSKLVSKGFEILKHKPVI